MTGALVEDTVPISSFSSSTPADELESRIRVLTFERDQAKVLMPAALVGRDASIAERDVFRAHSEELLA